MRLENWAVVIKDPYVAPELQTPCLAGEVYGSEKFADGTSITTSGIVGAEGNNTILTHSGSRYELGGIDPEYGKRFPEAKVHLIETAKILKVRRDALLN